MNELVPGPRGVDAAAAATPVRIVMIGFMGAGKSTVGQMLAEALGWRFVDLDDEIAAREGMPVDQIIRQQGLEHFRCRESQLGREELRRRQIVLSVGGGWPAQPGHMDSLGEDTVSIWLQVGVVSALERIAASTSVRPLLQVPHPQSAATALLTDREPYYRRGNIAIETEGKSPDQVLHAILRSLTASKSTNGPSPGKHASGEGRIEPDDLTMEHRKEDIE